MKHLLALALLCVSLTPAFAADNSDAAKATREITAVDCPEISPVLLERNLTGWTFADGSSVSSETANRMVQFMKQVEKTCRKP